MPRVLEKPVRDKNIINLSQKVSTGLKEPFESGVGVLERINGQMISGQSEGPGNTAGVAGHVPVKPCSSISSLI